MVLSSTSCTTRHHNASVYPEVDFNPSIQTSDWVIKNKAPNYVLEDLAKCKRAANITERLDSDVKVSTIDPGPTWLWISGLFTALVTAIKSLFFGIL